MTDYQKMYTLLFNAITDALMQMEKRTMVLPKKPSFPPSKGQKNSIYQQRTKAADRGAWLLKKRPR